MWLGKRKTCPILPQYQREIINFKPILRQGLIFTWSTIMRKALRSLFSNPVSGAETWPDSNISLSFTFTAVVVQTQSLLNQIYSSCCLRPCSWTCWTSYTSPYDSPCICSSANLSLCRSSMDSKTLSQPQLLSSAIPVQSPGPTLSPVALPVLSSIT